MAACRHLSAGILILGFFMAKGYKLPSPGAFRQFSINGILMLAGGNGIISWGMLYVESGLSALISALTPLWIIIINALVGNKEKVGKMAFAGFALCLLGQVFIFLHQSHAASGSNYAWGIAAVFASNIFWALGTVYSKNHKTNVHPLFGAGLQMIPGGLLLLLMAFFRGEFHELNPGSQGLMALGYLIVFGSIVGYGSYMYVLKKLPAAIVSTYAYINTMVAILLGWFWLGELVSIYTAVAAVFTILGVYLVNRNVVMG